MARFSKPVFWALFLLVQLSIASSVAEKLASASKPIADLSLEALDEQLQVSARPGRLAMSSD